MAEEAAWKDKAINQWSVEDARQVLADSPWAKTSIGTIGRLPNEDQRREGGQMGPPHGVGFDGVDRNARPVRLKVRWESALPIRAAEFKAGAEELPTLATGGYRIAVYGIPGAVNGDPVSLGNPLKKDAALKREGKKDLKPASVEVFQLEDGLAALYVFPVSAEIAGEDGTVEFAARIGRISVRQEFHTEEMRFGGKLEL